MGQHETNLRTNKSSYGLGVFSREILVKCPHCNNKAIVSTTGEYTIPYPSAETKSIFHCSNCFKSINEKSWYGPILISASNKKCGYCGAILNYSEKVNKFKNTIEIECEVCEKKKKYEVSYKLTFANNKQATDPYFGLELWLQASVDKNIFWAFNYDHLNYLKKYVSAKLREEKGISKYSLTQKLPDFIKLGKNREKILKIIDRIGKDDFFPN